ncbi:hypothetical protein [Natrinema salaciae]|nr:hypothetical protein [Natrinema salaciae]
MSPFRGRCTSWHLGGGDRVMAASGDETKMTLTFERPLTEEKVAERCRAIAEHLAGDDA